MTPYRETELEMFQRLNPECRQPLAKRKPKGLVPKPEPKQELSEADRMIANYRLATGRKPQTPKT